jgi:2-oxoglutarate ferredoxin oxidoreductase subunit alpha
MKRFSIKIGGQSGTGINTVGLILSKAFKRSGFYNTSYREYPSLIKGGFASYQIDISDKPFNSVSSSIDIYVAIDKWSFETLLKSIDENKIFFYDSNIIRVSEDEQAKLDKKNITVYDLPLSLTAKKTGGNTIMKNTVLMGAMWKLLDLDQKILLDSILKVFNKTKEIEEANVKCAKAGADLIEETTSILSTYDKDENLKEMISISGNEAIALGGIAGGVRAYIAYPMTPSTSILHTFAKFAKETKIVVKQAEDEITAVNMTIGANHGGTRAMCATSGGGFDLMSEGVSLAGITETPLVIALAQRPGPGTGVPTWTSQGDLKIAINAAHGEFSRIILAPGDVDECFNLTAKALNMAEKYQCVVIILTDKYLAETLYTTDEFDSSNIKIDRGEYIEKNDKLSSEVNRYELTEDGISKRWAPGDFENVYVANSDEHTPEGYSTEDSKEIKDMIDKRMRKDSVILKDLPEPTIYGEKDADISIIGWGSTKHIILDAIEELQDEISINFLYFNHVYPLKTSKLKKFAQNSKRLYVLENNEVGQFADLIQMKTGIMLENRILKYNASPFFIDEVIDKLRYLSRNE